MMKLVAVSGGPIEFNAATRDYTLKVRDTHWFDLFYCPFCGEPTPRQYEPAVIVHVDDDEQKRLLDLIQNCRNQDDIIHRIGLPDFENPKVDFVDPIWNEAVTFSPAILYTKLSGVANLRILFSDDFSTFRAIVEPKAKAALNPKNET